MRAPQSRQHALAVILVVLLCASAVAEDSTPPGGHVAIGAAVPVLPDAELVPVSGPVRHDAPSQGTRVSLPIPGSINVVFQSRVDVGPDRRFLDEWLRLAGGSDAKVRVVAVVLAPRERVAAARGATDGTTPASYLRDPRLSVVADPDRRFQLTVGRYVMTGVSWQEVVVVTPDGRLAWAGLPEAAGDALRRVVDGDWDPAEWDKSHQQARGERNARARLSRDLAQLGARRDFGAMVACIEARGMDSPGHRMQRGFYLVMAGQADRGYAVIRQETMHPAWDRPAALLAVVERILADPDLADRDLRLACELGERALRADPSAVGDACSMIAVAALAEALRVTSRVASGQPAGVSERRFRGGPLFTPREPAVQAPAAGRSR